MRTISIGKLVDLSINRTKLILFQPFSLKKWLCLLFIAFMAGALGSGNGSGGSNHNWPKKAEAVDYGYTVEQEKIDQFGSSYGEFEPDSYPFYYEKLKLKFAFLKKASVWAGFLIIFPLTILFMWLSSRFKFIWFDSIIKNDASVAEPFRQHKDKGNSLFIFYLTLLILTLTALGLIALWIFGVGKALGLFKAGGYWSFAGVMSTFLMPVITAICGIMFLVILYLAIDHFVVTIMAIDNCPFKAAWQKFINIYKGNQKEFWFYLLVLMGLGIICGIIALVIILACLIPILLVGALLFGIPYLLFKMGAIFIIIAIILGIPFIALTLALLMSINLPLAVFFRSFSLYFLSSIECEYNPLPLE